MEYTVKYCESDFSDDVAVKINFEFLGNTYVLIGVTENNFVSEKTLLMEAMIEKIEL